MWHIYAMSRRTRSRPSSPLPKGKLPTPWKGASAATTVHRRNLARVGPHKTARPLGRRFLYGGGSRATCGITPGPCGAVACCCLVGPLSIQHVDTREDLLPEVGDVIVDDGDLHKAGVDHLEHVFVFDLIGKELEGNWRLFSASRLSR